MRRIIVSNLVSTDGFFARLNGDLDWFVVDEEFFAYMRNLLQSVDTILFGRSTYELLAQYWPVTTQEDPIITERMNGLRKFVFSSTLVAAQWNNTTIERELNAECITRLKRQNGHDMVVFGSGKLIQALTSMKLIDEYRLVVNPIVLGNGRPMFECLTIPIPLKLKEVKPLWSGVVILSYEPE